MIEKVIDGESRVVATGIVDHSQLSGRDTFNAHPIEAIRGLSVLLRKIQNNIANNRGTIDENLKDIAEMQILITNLQEALSNESNRASESETELKEVTAQLTEDKLDKVTQVVEDLLTYIVRNGQQETLVVKAEGIDGDSVVQRTADGRVKAAAPSEKEDVTTKAYVDGLKNQLSDDIIDMGNSVKEELNSNVDALYEKLKLEGLIPETEVGDGRE